MPIVYRNGVPRLRAIALAGLIAAALLGYVLWGVGNNAGWGRSACLASTPFAGISPPPPPATVGLFDMLEVVAANNTIYSNPFDYTEIELRARFVAPSGKVTGIFGFYDGDGRGGQTGNVWRLRFMPNELGTWSYDYRWSDETTGGAGVFEVTEEGSKPGPWKQNPSDPRWLMTARGEHFLPVVFFAAIQFTPIDWEDAIEWARAKGFNSIYTGSFNYKTWGTGWPNVTPFQELDASEKTVDYACFNLKMWAEWDDMLRAAGRSGIYIASADGPAGDYGGQSGVGTVFPPTELAYHPKFNQPFDDPENLRLMRYLVARQAAFWNLAYWNLYPGEMFDIPHYNDGSKVVAYGEYLASITPFGRMITSQDIEQYETGSLSATNRTWLAQMDFPSTRKLNTVQGGTPRGPQAEAFRTAATNNAFALEATSRGFPVLATETLWEGQPRAKDPLRIIWGNYAAGMHTLWADWSFEDGVDGGRWGSLGKAWTPLKPLDQHVYTVDRLGADTNGDEYLRIAADALRRLEFWRMAPRNELVAGSTEAYALAEVGRQYMIYAPQGGTVQLDLKGLPGPFEAKWFDPREGGYLGGIRVDGGETRSFEAPDTRDWVLFVLAKTSTH